MVVDSHAVVVSAGRSFIPYQEAVAINQQEQSTICQH